MDGARIELANPDVLPACIRQNCEGRQRMLRRAHFQDVVPTAFAPKLERDRRESNPHLLDRQSSAQPLCFATESFVNSLMFLGGLTRFELATIAVTVRCSTKLSYNPHKQLRISNYELRID